MDGGRGGRGDGAPATFRDVFVVREFRALWGAQLLSVIGDQFALVALAVLVFQRTESPLLTAAAYGLSFLPWVVGGPLLSGLADRLPRRSVMVVCDLVRAGVVALMALPGVPLWLLCALLFLAELCSPPFAAARAAALPDVLPGDRYVVGNAVAGITGQVGQAAGFALGGLVVAGFGARQALLMDAATFALSAVLLRLRVAAHVPPAALRRRAEGGGAGGGSLLESTREGVRLLVRRRDLRTLAGLGWLCAFSVVPEGLAVPYVAQVGGTERDVGLLLAAFPTGAVVGALVVSRWCAPARRLALMGPLAVGSCAPLVVCFARPGLLTSALLFAVSGAASAYQLAANAAFVAAVPAETRGQAFGLVQAGINVGQGLAIVVAGAVAQVVDVRVVVASSGLAGCAVAARLWYAWNAVHAPPTLASSPALGPPASRPSS